MYFLQLTPKEIPVDSTVVSKLSEGIEKLSTMSLHDLLNMAAKWGVELVKNIVIALIVYYVGRWIIRRIDRLLGKIFTRRHVEVSLSKFLRNLTKTVLYILILTIVISILGINTTSFVAILASAGFAVGMALSGTLQNFAGGVMILLLKPFRVGDYIIASGQEGTVKEIQLFSTILNTNDNKTIIVPNGSISTSIVNNFSKETTRRVDWQFSIAYGDDYDLAKATIEELFNQDERILNDPKPFIALKSLDDSCVTITARAWTENANYWNVFFDMNEKVYKTFPKKGLNIPFPQLDVHISND